MCEQFRGEQKSEEGGKKKDKKERRRGRIDTQAPVFHVLSACFPVISALPLLSNDSAADVISPMLLRRCQPH